MVGRFWRYNYDNPAILLLALIRMIHVTIWYSFFLSSERKIKAKSNSKQSQKLGYPYLHLQNNKKCVFSWAWGQRRKLQKNPKAAKKGVQTQKTHRWMPGGEKTPPPPPPPPWNTHVSYRFIELKNNCSNFDSPLSSLFWCISICLKLSVSLGD